MDYTLCGDPPGLSWLLLFGARPQSLPDDREVGGGVSGLEDPYLALALFISPCVISASHLISLGLSSSVFEENAIPFPASIPGECYGKL